uniref:Uncharacterized protein LOC104227902 isoform X1 n=1 Tax=Nicotiana sylvestris TaxID=4096 RepID=A0A1U7WIU9_NICSY|nr:PREDICTED: uncharacterized protein LOC104227902 isoform X1 [Nicotiana sylvestris]
MRNTIPTPICPKNTNPPKFGLQSHDLFQLLAHEFFCVGFQSCKFGASTTFSHHDFISSSTIFSALDSQYHDFTVLSNQFSTFTIYSSIFSPLCAYKTATLDYKRKCPKECREVVSSLIFAAARLADVPELRQLRSVFTDIYRNSLECYLNKEVRKVTSSMQQRTLPWL